MIHNGSQLPTIAIVTTGGTIAEKTDPKTGGAVPAVSGAELVDAVPQLKAVANLAVVNFSNIDSSQMTPDIWLRLSKVVDELLERKDIAGAVVTHGTDTMAEGAYFLDLTLTSDKPVVFTGAMNDASSPNPDGPNNILNAVIQASSKDGKGWGVTVTLNDYINGAREVRKTQTTNVQTFTSGVQGYLGYIFNGKVTRFNERANRQNLPRPDKLPKVVFISTYAGADGNLVRYAVDNGAKGIVIEGVGAGNVNAETFDAILYALNKDVAVVVASRVYYGAVEPVYGDQGGGATLKQKGAILGGNLMGTKAHLLLMLGLAEYGNDAGKLKKLFIE
ncbi:MAG: asparaginase [Hyphomicrobiales bacterium]|nr:asparaginase [Hyphomicrobiales bacterium]